MAISFSKFARAALLALGLMAGNLLSVAAASLSPQSPIAPTQACQSPTSLRESFSAVLYDAAAPGDGFYLVADRAYVSIAYFGYASNAQLLWLVGTLPRASLVSNQELTIPMLAGGAKGHFTAPQNPAKDALVSWGTAALTVRCGADGRLTGTVRLQGIDGSKSLGLTALIDSGNSVAPAPQTLAITKSGSVFFDAGASGDGFYLAGDAANLSLAYFGYTATGERLWLTGAVPVSALSNQPGDTLEVPMLRGGFAGRFAQAQNPAVTAIPEWGSLRLKLSCDPTGRVRGSARLEGSDGDKSMRLDALLDTVICPAAPGATITIATPSTAPKAYARSTLTVSNATIGLSRLVLETDISGRGDFLRDNTLSNPLAIQDGVGVFVAPPLFLFQRASSNPTYHVRVVGLDGSSSNRLTLQQPRANLAALRRGHATVTLEVAIKGLYTALDDPLLGGVVGQLRPGAGEAALRTLGQSSALADENAAALLNASFGFDITAPGATADDAPTSITGLREALQSVSACVGPLIADALTGPVNAGEICFTQTVNNIRDQFIPALSEVHSSFATVTSRLSSMLGSNAGSALANYAERVALHAQMTGYADEFAQIALRLPPIANGTGPLTEYIGGRLSAYGRTRLYDALVSDFGEFDQQVLEILGAPDAFNASLNLTTQRFGALRDLEDQLTSTGALDEQLATSPESYGGEGDGASAPIPGGSVEEICADPEFQQATVALGFPSCEAYVRPFLDPGFFQSSIQPILDRLIALLPALEACISAPENSACDALLQQATDLNDELFAALRNYGEGSCDGGYAQFELAESLTCVWQSLIAPSSGGCPAGSKLPNYSVGNTSICTYYSRDYVRNGQCRQNYSLVFFQPINAQTCRWSSLPVDKPVAYTLDKSSNNRRTLER